MDNGIRPVPAARSPYPGASIGSASFTIGTEAGNAINVAIQLQSQFRKDLKHRGRVRVYLAADANGDSLTPFYNLPTSIAVGTDGLLLPGAMPDSGLLVAGGLAIHSTPEQFKTTATAEYLVNRRYKTKAGTTGLTFTAAHTVTASKYGVILVQINAAGTISTKVPSATQAYNTAALALAALPAPDSGNVPLGYIAIANNAGDWVANTDDLTDGSDLTTATFVDWPLNGYTAPVFDLISESDGDIDITLSTVKVVTYYLAVILPDGKLVVSNAISFT